MKKLIANALDCVGYIGLILMLLDVWVPYSGYVAVAAFFSELIFLSGAIKVEFTTVDYEHKACCASTSAAAQCPCNDATSASTRG